MEQLSVNDGPQVVLSRVRVLAIRLSARPDTRSLASAIILVRDGLKRALDAYEERKDERMAATGAVGFADTEEDELIASLARRMRVIVEGNLQDPRYLATFSMAPSEATSGVASDDQARFVGQVITTLESLPELAELADLVPDLKAARAAVVAAQEAHAAAEIREGVAWNALQAAEASARAAFADAEPRLMLIFPGQRRKVDSFYPATRKRKKAPEPTPA